MPKIKVAVLMGGKSAEREVSLKTGQQVLNALDPAKYEVLPIDTAHLSSQSLPGARALGEGGEAAEEASPARITADALTGHPAPAGSAVPLAGKNRPDVAFICLHGRFGEDGTIQGLLELLEIPYVGSGVLASALAMNKVMAKKIFRIEGIPTPREVVIRGRSAAEEYLRSWETGTAAVGCPAVVKPSTQGSTIGITIVKEPGQMAAALDLALKYDPEVLVEEFIDGIEITGPVLGNDELIPLPLVEIVPASGFYDYEAKYTPGATDEVVPARITPEQTRIAQDLAIRAHRALGCRGFSRTDMLVSENGIHVLEVNTIPGMTQTSLLPRSAEAAGIPFPELVDRIVQLALEGRCNEPTPAARA